MPTRIIGTPSSHRSLTPPQMERFEYSTRGEKRNRAARSTVLSIKHPGANDEPLLHEAIRLRTADGRSPSTRLLLRPLCEPALVLDRDRRLASPDEIGPPRKIPRLDALRLKLIH